VTAALVVAAGLLGLPVGSYLTRLIWRVPRKDVEHPAAMHCPSCQAPLATADMIPVVSWLLLRARCRACQARIPAWYPLVELSCSALFVLSALVFGPDPALPAFLVLAASFLALSVIDLQLRLLPNRIIYPTGFAAGPLLVIAALLREEPMRIVGGLAGGAAAFAAFFVLNFIRPDGMAFGDVRLSFLVGMGVGWLAPSLIPVALLLAFVSSSVIGLAYGAVTRRWLKATIPFGPFLAAGAEITILLSDRIRSPWSVG
jgi:leader peptidase (prepilin peptidase)/N-methyltransferase